MKKVVNFFKKVLNFQTKIIPNELLLKAIYIISMLALAGITNSGLIITLTLIAMIWTSVRNEFPSLDKLQHYYMGVIYFLIFGLPLVKFIGLSNGWYFIPALILGVTKEVFDSIANGNAEANDLVKTVQFSILYYLLLT